MMRGKIFFSLLLSLFAAANYAADRIIQCDEPFGMRVDYFSYNNINLPNETFNVSKDHIAGVQPKIIIHDDKNITFQIGDAAEMRGETKSGNMQMIINNDDQMTFAGQINQAPIMGTYYPKVGILIFNQQSIWPGPDFIGARAVMLYSKCHIIS